MLKPLGEAVFFRIQESQKSLNPLWNRQGHEKDRRESHRSQNGKPTQCSPRNKHDGKSRRADERGVSDIDLQDDQQHGNSEHSEGQEESVFKIIEGDFLA